MSDCWDDIAVKVKVEVVNTDCDNFNEEYPDYYWVASIIRIAGLHLFFFVQYEIGILLLQIIYVKLIIFVGYKAKLRYEGYGSDERSDFWVNLCSNVIHPVGWCATRGKPLIPPKCKC